MINSVIENDGFLTKLHALVLMDDTVILSCSRDLYLQKMAKVLEFCNEYGMEINLKKTSFFVINGGELDYTPLECGEMNIPYKTVYCYLGSYFSDDGKVSSALKLHIKSKTADINSSPYFVLVIRQSLSILKNKSSTVVCYLVYSMGVKLDLQTTLKK